MKNSKLKGILFPEGRLCEYATSSAFFRFITKKHSLKSYSFYLLNCAFNVLYRTGKL